MAAGGVSLALCLAGAVSLGEGVAVPVKAELAQRLLERTFEHRLRVASYALATAPKPARRAVSQTGKRVVAPSSPAAAHGRAGRQIFGRAARHQQEIVLAGDGSHDQLAEGPVIKRGGDASQVTILAAHRDTHFQFIRDLREGDEVTMRYVNGAVEGYDERGWRPCAGIGSPIRSIRPRPLLALSTCFPERDRIWRPVAPDRLGGSAAERLPALWRPR